MYCSKGSGAQHRATGVHASGAGTDGVRFVGAGPDPVRLQPALVGTLRHHRTSHSLTAASCTSRGLALFFNWTVEKGHDSQCCKNIGLYVQTEITSPIYVE